MLGYFRKDNTVKYLIWRFSVRSLLLFFMALYWEKQAPQISRVHINLARINVVLPSNFWKRFCNNRNDIGFFHWKTNLATRGRTWQFSFAFRLLQSVGSRFGALMFYPLLFRGVFFPCCHAQKCVFHFMHLANFVNSAVQVTAFDIHKYDF